MSIGYFLPNYPLKSLPFLGVMIIFAFILGWIFPDMMNKGTLLSKDDLHKVTLKSKISIYRTNTQSLWIGIFFCAVSITNLLKVVLLYYKLNQLSIFIFTFGVTTIIKIYNIKK